MADTANKEATATTYQINVTASRIKGQTDDGRKYDFLAFDAIDKRGKKSKLKFVKDLQRELPTEEGDYILTVDKRYISRDYQSKYVQYWVRQIESFEKFEPSYRENTEDLPF